MKQVKQIIEFILVVASCFFRKRKQPKVHPYIPEDPYPPGSCNGGKGDCPGCTGCNCNPQSAPASGQSQAYRQNRTSDQRAVPAQSCTSDYSGDRSQYDVVPSGTTPSTGASNLLGWCLIAVAGTSYLYKLLA
ncbi:hypothetical protein SDC9_61545 [bioreactor metagenome]|uniref:Uncharacterized protein n=1 Tax=bioreactor metagenome TaxID=1076179 RepID=A0A644XGF5_9ZZZZ|nr:hypothetical protein [Macellibacteroides fermentans]